MLHNSEHLHEFAADGAAVTVSWGAPREPALEHPHSVSFSPALHETVDVIRALGVMQAEPANALRLVTVQNLIGSRAIAGSGSSTTTSRNLIVRSSHSLVRFPSRRQ